MPAISGEVRDLLDRIERRVAGRVIREVAMFGAIAVMVEESMLVAVNRDRSLLVRVDPAAGELLQHRAEASVAQMGANRSMGTGWLRIDGISLEEEEILQFWLDHALKRLDADTGIGSL